MKHRHPVMRIALVLATIAIALAQATAFAQPATPPAAVATLRADRPGPVVNRNIYGHFAEHLGRGIYDGIWVGPRFPDSQHARHPQRRGGGAQGAAHPRAALAGRLLRRRVPLERRHRPREKRPAMINTHWGGVVEDNSFGTHEFMDLVRSARHRRLHHAATSAAARPRR